MAAASLDQRRSEIEEYFDRTAAAAWARLTSTEHLGRIRASVRAGRERMRATLLSFLPADLSGARVLDAGSGTGAGALALAARDADVLAVELSPTLSALARDRAGVPARGSLRFAVGDMTDPGFGEFTHVFAMDSLIHYRTPDLVALLARLAPRTRSSLVFTFAPRTPLLALMHALGRAFPRANRSPAIEPVSPRHLARLIAAEPALAGFRLARTARIASGFYISQAQELVRR